MIWANVKGCIRLYLMIVIMVSRCMEVIVFGGPFVFMVMVTAMVVPKRLALPGTSGGNEVVILLVGASQGTLDCRSCFNTVLFALL